MSTGQHILEEEAKSHEDDPESWLTSDEDDDDDSDGDDDHSIDSRRLILEAL